MLQRSPTVLTAPIRRLLSRNRRLSTGGIVSLAGHLMVVLALLITLPNWNAEEDQPPDTSIEMDLPGQGAIHHQGADARSWIPAPSREVAPPAAAR